MPDLTFQVNGAEPVAFAAAPTMAFKLSATNAPAAETIHNVLLNVQIRIDTPKRQYTPAEKARLVELFGAPERWGQTLRPMLWTHANVVVPPFSGAAAFELHAPCSFDFNVGATKYFDGLSQGDTPLLFLFSGTVFYAGEQGALQVARISWSKEARFHWPAAEWRKLMQAYYPNTAWLALRKDVFDRLAALKAREGLSSWEQTLESLLARYERASDEELIVQ